ncbi:M48 family metalloprotease [Micromonospora costi]|uniref:M48 family metalloprotease n=1 Tax=Micromonospora costi TaxID=1530042 RepID=UPI0033C7B4DA
MSATTEATTEAATPPAIPPGSPPATAFDDQRALRAGALPRFVLLLALFVGIAATISVNVIDARTDPDGMRVGCGLAAGGDPGLSDLDVVVRIADQRSAYEACVDRFVPAQAWWWKPGSLLLLLICAAALYWILPLWKGRRGRVVPVEEVEGYGDLRATLAELVAVAGLRRPPRFVIAPATPTAGAVVFGRFRRYTVCLDGGLLARRRSDDEGFRAVVLHELAHLHNRDVDITYATVALWRVLLWVVLPIDLLYIAAVSLPGTAGTYMETREQSRVVHHVAMLAVTVVLVYLARADILRTREFHADLTARRWGADVRLWQAAAGSRPDARQASAVGRLKARAASLWHTHPTWGQRWRSLADPGALFVPGALAFFLTGATAAITATRMPALLSLLGIPQAWRTWVISVTVAVLVTSITGLLLRPAATYAVLTSGPAPSGLRVAGWLGVGLVLGEIAVGRAGSVWDLLPEDPAFLLLHALAAFAVTWWMAEYALLSAASSTGGRPRWTAWLGLVVGCAVLALWWRWWEAEGHVEAGGMLAFLGEGVVRQHEQALTSGQGYEGPLLDLVPGLPVLLALTRRADLLWTAGALWLLPLLSGLRRPAPTRPRRTLLAGAGLAAVGAVMLVVAVTAALRAWSPVIDGRAQTHLVAYTMWAMAAVALGMWLAAGVTAAVARDVPLLRGLVVAATVGLVGLVTMGVLLAGDGCARPLAILASSCRPDLAGGGRVVELLAPTVLGLGLFLAVGVAAVGVLAAASVRRLRGRGVRAGRGSAAAARPPEPVTARPRWRTAAGVAGLCLLATATIAAVTVSDVRSSARADTAADVLDPVFSGGVTSPAVRAAQVHAWLVLGGSDLTLGIAKSLAELAEPLDAATSDPARRVLNDWTVIEAQMRPRCRAVSESVSAGRRYFHHPDPRGEAAWEALLTRADQIGAECDRAIGQRDRSGYVASLQRLAPLGEDLTAMARAIAG